MKMIECTILRKIRSNFHFLLKVQEILKSTFYIRPVDNNRKKDIPKKLVECRCGSCGSLLARAAIVNGMVELKCGKCGTLNTISIQPEGRAA